MKNLIYTFFSIFLLTIFSNSLLAQESDYEIKEAFLLEHRIINNQLDNVSSVTKIDSLKHLIVNFINEFEPHKDLIDNALYPSSFSFEIGALQKESNVAEQRLLIIENQNDRLFKLSNKLDVFKREIALLNIKTDSLNRAIESSQKSEERLAGLVKRYRTNLESRDELIMDVIDSLMLTYSGISSTKISELSSGIKSGRISENENPLKIIEAILNENIEFSKNNTRALSVEDHLRMYAVQRHFSETWDQIGPQLIEAYGGSEKTQWTSAIDQRVKDWRMNTSQKMWQSMDKYLEFSNVDLGAFDNNYSFFIALDSFVKSAEQTSKDEILSSESYEKYKKFELFWSNKIKNEWSNLVQDSEILSVTQISAIDEQLNSWEAESRPIHPFLIVLLVITLISLLAFSFVQFKVKSA